MFVETTTTFAPTLPMVNFTEVNDIERHFCSNFTCCNQVFPDLHTLMDHRDRHSCRAHVSDGLASSTTPTTPTSTSTRSSSPSPPSSPLTPSTPAALFDQWTLPANGEVYETEKVPSLYVSEGTPNLPSWGATGMNFGLLEDLDVGEVPIYEQCFNAAVSSIKPPDPTTENTPFPTPPPSAQNDNLLKPLPMSLPSPRPSIPPPVRWRARSQEFQPTEKIKRIKSTASLKEDVLQKKTKKPDGRGPGRKREKQYVCPTPGCTKSYLNPNGLKYHREKGTCNIELPLPGDVPPSPPSHAVDSSPISPPVVDFPDTFVEQPDAGEPSPADPASSMVYTHPDVPTPVPSPGILYTYTPMYSNSSSSLSMWNGGVPI